MSINCFINLKNNVLLIGTGINNLNIFKIMAKKVKYYGVLAIKSMNTKHCDDFPEELKDFINAVKKKTTVARVFVFDNETEQVECLANVEGCDRLIDIEAVSKEDFLNQVLSLKAEHIYNDDDDVESDDEDPGETQSPC